MDTIITAITNLLAGGSAADFQTACAGFTPAKINRTAALQLQAGNITLDQFRTVVAAQK